MTDQKTCTWEKSPPDDIVREVGFSTSCENFIYIDGVCEPFKYCPYCSGEIKEIANAE